ncbi:unnamed protein product [Microthlaspi erraticum]|uniref:FBD domain-containing protein n=1 Tax=Microthlaspi erraticum TaxID=1685480 RepID=A0A6D2IJJ2_9BRAS|nr:unnamed protein product [Microthlaspi erraticum]
MVPNIKFDSGSHKSDQHGSFSEIVCRTLLSSNSPVLDSFSLVDISESEVSKDLESWIGIAFARHVRKLVLKLRIDYQVQDLITFPSVFCGCNNTLEILELKYKYLFVLDFPCRVGLKSLKKLDLRYVGFEGGEECVCNLLGGCPSLEDLVVYRKGNYDAKTFTIAVPSLRRLTIKDSFQGTRNGGYVIKAPCLKYLKIKGVGSIDTRFGSFSFIGGHCSLGGQGIDESEWYGFCLIENAPQLVEAKIIGVIDIHVHNENIMESLTSAQRLSLDFSPLKVCDEISYHFFRHIGMTKQKKISTAGECEWEQHPKRVPECLLSHLETLVWTRYAWDREDDKQVATYILENARRLKKATFYTEPIQPNIKSEEREMLLNELANVARASNSCHLMFESSD